MAELLPIGCKLLASPIPNEDGTIDKEFNLISFYESSGFKLQKDKYGNPYMEKS